MRFLVHGDLDSDAQTALARHEQACHLLLELSNLTDAASEAASDPARLLPLLDKKQWNLATTDADFVHALYENKLEFHGLIILILPDPEKSGGQGNAIDRLFERYPRLSSRRLYTITPNRVKIRQLPGRP